MAPCFKFLACLVLFHIMKVNAILNTERFKSTRNTLLLDNGISLEVTSTSKLNCVVQCSVNTICNAANYIDHSCEMMILDTTQDLLQMQHILGWTFMCE